MDRTRSDGRGRSFDTASSLQGSSTGYERNEPLVLRLVSRRPAPRGDYKQSDYGKVILPFTVLRRLDCVLEATKPAVLAEVAKRQRAGVNPEPFLLKKAGQHFFNASPLDMKTLMGDQDHVRENLFEYLKGFSENVRDIFARFEVAGLCKRDELVELWQRQVVALRNFKRDAGHQL